MKKCSAKIIAVLALLFIGSLMFGQEAPPPPPITNRAPTPGAPASPIDDYIFFLLPFAVMLIVFITTKYRRQLK